MKKILVCFVFVMAFGLVFAQNLVQNGDLESWADASTPDNWDVIENITQTTTTVHGGTYAAAHTAASSTKDFRQTVTGISGGQDYTISYWYYDNDTSAKARIWAYWLNGTSTISDNADVLRPSTYSDDIDGWQQWSVTLTAPATADGFRFEVRAYNQDGNYGGQVLYDDFSVEMQVTGDPVISNVIATPAVPGSTDPVTISATITDPARSIVTAECYWGTTDSMSNTIAMSNTTGDTWETTTQIPAHADGTTIYYKVSAVDDMDNGSLSPMFTYDVMDLQTVTIYDIQGQAAASPYDGQTLTTSGIVTAIDGNNYWIQDGAGAWNGVYVYGHAAHGFTVGDDVTITCDVVEYNGLTELTNVASATLNSSSNPLPAPTVITTGAFTEEYEGVLIKVVNATCTNADLGYGEWEVNDGSGPMVGDDQIYNFDPVLGTIYDITGVGTYNYGTYKMLPREAGDIVEQAQEQAPVISDVVNTPEIPGSSDAVTISATIVDPSRSVTSASCWWGLSETGMTNEIAMSNTTGDTWETDTPIPAQTDGTTVWYMVQASDDATNTTDSDNFNYTVTDAQVITIYDIQGQTAVSPYDGQIVTTTGIVTAIGNDRYWIQDGTGAWNGLYVFDNVNTPALGDNITVTGEIQEYYEMTELYNITDYVLNSSSNPLPAATLIATGDMAEDYEGVLVKVQNASCTAMPNTNGEWFVNDGSGDVQIDDVLHGYTPVLGSNYDVTGVVDYSWSEYGILPRDDNDIVPLTVDNTPPGLTSVVATGASTVVVTFDEPVDETTAEEPFNYYIVASTRIVTIDSAVRDDNDNAVVTLTVSGMTAGDYNIEINDVEDLFGNGCENLAGTFTYTPAVVPDIIITEIMQNPSAVGDTDGEWFEVYNNDTVTVDMEGWTFVDLGTNTTTVNNGAPLQIAPGEYFVFGRNSDSGTNGGVTVDFQYDSSSFTLGNGGDELIIYMADGTTEVDRVEYDGGPNWPDPNGSSMMFVGSWTDDNNDYSYWVVADAPWAGSAGDNGTPGEANGGSDTDAPVITDVIATSATEVSVLFDEAVDETIAETAGNYQIDARVTVDSAMRDDSDYSLVHLTVSGMTEGDYTLTVMNIEDLFGNAITSATYNFTYEVIAPVDLVINELMYNSDDSSAYEWEWFELYNNGTETVDLENYYILDDSDGHTPVVIPSGITIGAGMFITIMLKNEDPATAPFVPTWDASAVCEWGLGNDVDAVRLFNPIGTLIDEVNYSQDAPWPMWADGYGPSLELVDVTTDNNDGANWAASAGVDGTPNYVNSIHDGGMTYVMFTGFDATVGEDVGTYDITIQILNPDATSTTTGWLVLSTGDAADLGNYTDTQFTFPAGDTTPQTVTVTVTDDSEEEVIESFLFEFSNVQGGNGAAIAWLDQFTLNVTDNDMSLPEIAITEIMNNPASVSDDDGEWFEIHNYGTTDVDIAGWYVQDNDTDSFMIDDAAPVIVPAGAWFVFCCNADSGTNGGVPVDYAYDGANFTLANGGDEVVLLMADGSTEVDRVDYDDDWANWPDPSGASMMFMGDASVDDNNNLDNWQEATTAWTGSAGDFGTPGESNTGSSQLDAPTNVQIMIQGADVHLSWDAVTGATTYHIYRSTTPDGTYTELISTGNAFFDDLNAAVDGTPMYFYYITAE